MTRTVVLSLLLLTSCTRPRHGIYTMLGGLGVAVGGVAVGSRIDEGAAAPGDGFGVMVVSAGVGVVLVSVGLLWAVFSELDTPRVPEDRTTSGHRGVGRGRAIELGDQAREAAKSGDCTRARDLERDAQIADEEYYDTVLRADPVLGRCSR